VTTESRAACRGVPTAMFFPTAEYERKTGAESEATLRAKAICASCPVSGACFQYAVANPELTGIWGGTTTRERVAIRRGGIIWEAS